MIWSTWSTWSAVISLTSRAGELRSAPRLLMISLFSLPLLRRRLTASAAMLRLLLVCSVWATTAASTELSTEQPRSSFEGTLVVGARSHRPGRGLAPLLTRAELRRALPHRRGVADGYSCGAEWRRLQRDASAGRLFCLSLGARGCETSPPARHTRRGPAHRWLRGPTCSRCTTRSARGPPCG